jgi:hypothetical protein
LQRPASFGTDNFKELSFQVVKMSTNGSLTARNSGAEGDDISLFKKEAKKQAEDNGGGWLCCGRSSVAPEPVRIENKNIYKRICIVDSCITFAVQNLV